MQTNMRVPLHFYIGRGPLVVRVEAGENLGSFTLSVQTYQVALEIHMDEAAAGAIHAAVSLGLDGVRTRKDDARMDRIRGGLDDIRAHGLTQDERAQRLEKDAELRRLSREMQEAEGGYVAAEDQEEGR